MQEPRILFSTGSLYIFDVSYCFELSAEAGYDGVEIMCDERWSTRDPEYLLRMSKQYHQPIHVIHTPFSKKTPGWKDPNDEIQRIQHTIALAEAVNAESIVVHLPPKRDKFTINVNGRVFNLPAQLTPDHPVKRWIENDLPATQAKTKVKIALENMPSYYIAGQMTNPMCWNEIETWSQVHQWLTLDTTHWGTKKINPVEAYKAAGERVAHVHLSNYNGHEHQLPHNGNLNLKAFMRELGRTAYQGTVSLELNPHSLLFKDPHLLRRNLRDSVEFCRKHWKS